jgi:3,4-dihydroxy-2-butanone 4-phosphate synthase
MLASIETALAVLARGEMIVVVDDEDRENEGDLLMLAEYADAKSIAFMAVHGRGLICLALDAQICDALDLPPMTQSNRSRTGTAFTVSIEAATGVTTGISAADRARTIQAAVAKEASAKDIVSPGHIFPLASQDGGVLVRAGHTEAGCDLARLAGLEPAAVIVPVRIRPWITSTEVARPMLLAVVARSAMAIAAMASWAWATVVAPVIPAEVSPAMVSMVCAWQRRPGALEMSP